MVQARERRPEPLGVRRVAACDQQREPHHVASEPRGDHASPARRRPRPRAGRSGSSCASRRHWQPSNQRQTGSGYQASASRTRASSPVSSRKTAPREHAEQELLWRHEPVGGRERPGRVHAELRDQPLGQRRHRHVVLDGDGPPAVAHGPVAEASPAGPRRSRPRPPPRRPGRRTPAPAGPSRGRSSARCRTRARPIRSRSALPSAARRRAAARPPRGRRHARARSRERTPDPTPALQQLATRRGRGRGFSGHVERHRRQPTGVRRQRRRARTWRALRSIAAGGYSSDSAGGTAGWSRTPPSSGPSTSSPSFRPPRPRRPGSASARA